MDEAQRNHLKAYGVTFHLLEQGLEVDWLLNYRGGSFLTDYNVAVAQECMLRGVTLEIVSAEQVARILEEIASPAVNMNVVRLERAPRIAVYSPKNEIIQDESDAVILVLDYAEIPYTIIYDEEILTDALTRYDWVHLHHEDFTGQKGRHLHRETAAIETQVNEATAQRFGFAKVSHMKLEVAHRIKTYASSGGYLFAMCSGAETLDIALAADGVDICESIYDGDPADPQASQKLDFAKTLAFENFVLEDPYSRKFSTINASTGGPYFDDAGGYFKLFNYSAKWDIIPSLLTQNHESVIREFIGQTSTFSKALIKPEVLIMGENRSEGKVRYMYGEVGKGHWTFYSGHDPEGWPGRGRKRNLALHANSPGYRLILNNVLFPSARRIKQKT